jgi:hypothetical protein
MDHRQSGNRECCGAVSSGGSRNIACPGCRRQRYSTGTGECARAQRLGQRSQRHRQRGKGASDTAADHHSGCAADRLGSRCLPRVAGAADGKDQTNAICGIQIARLGGPGGRQRAGQAAQRQNSKHLQGMLSSLPRPNASEEYRPLLRGLVKQASRRMDTTHGLGMDSRPSFETRAPDSASALPGGRAPQDEVCSRCPKTR